VPKCFMYDERSSASGPGGCCLMGRLVPSLTPPAPRPASQAPLPAYGPAS
jgi:hypothetical protein